MYTYAFILCVICICRVFFYITYGFFAKLTKTNSRECIARLNDLDDIPPSAYYLRIVRLAAIYNGRNHFVLNMYPMIECDG